MGMLGLSDQEQIDIFAIVSAILHLGNARFATKVLYCTSPPKQLASFVVTLK